MRRTLLSILAASTVAVAIPTLASAQSWPSMTSRQAAVDSRIDVGVRNGSLTWQEAQRLRTDFNALVRLENQYRSGGLSRWEMDDLERRYDALSRTIQTEVAGAYDYDDRYAYNTGYETDTWRDIERRRGQLEQRIDVGLRNGQLTQAEARRLRTEFNQIVSLENQYRRSGGYLSTQEIAELDRRFDMLARDVRLERRDDERLYGQRTGDIMQRLSLMRDDLARGLTSGMLTRSEHDRLLREYNDLERVERQYRAGGLSQAERADLMYRADLVQQRIDYAMGTATSGYAWANLEQRQAELDRRIDLAVRDGRLTRRQADDLRDEFRDIVNLERRYRSNGLSDSEVRELDRRMAMLETEFRAEVGTSAYGSGYGSRSVFDDLWDAITGRRSY